MLRVSAKNPRREASRLYKKQETRSIASLQKTRDAKLSKSTDIIENGSVARWLLLLKYLKIYGSVLIWQVMVSEAVSDTKKINAKDAKEAIEIKW